MSNEKLPLQTNLIFKFPKPLYNLIFNHLDAKSLSSASMSCKFFKQMALNNAYERVKPYTEQALSFKKCLQISETFKKLSIPAIEDLPQQETTESTLTPGQEFKIINTYVYHFSLKQKNNGLWQDITENGMSVLGVCTHQEKKGPFIFICYIDKNSVYKVLISLDSNHNLKIVPLSNSDMKKLTFICSKSENCPYYNYNFLVDPMILEPVNSTQLISDFKQICLNYKNQVKLDSIEDLLNKMTCLNKNTDLKNAISYTFNELIMDKSIPNSIINL